MVCIYCLQEKPLSGFKKREHVLPQCFGKFKSGNPILNEIVCDDCNQYFGEKLELPLGRDSIWGVERYRHGIKPKKHPKHKRLKFRHLDGPFKGMVVTPIYSDGVEGVDNVPDLQVGIFNSLTNDFDYYEPDEVPRIESLKKEGRETKGLKINLIFKNDEEKQVLLSKLKEQGYKTEDKVTSMEWPEELKQQKQTWVAGQITLDRIVSRGLCKIAFNYLAFVQGRSFVLSSDFDGIRNFIRNDQGNQNKFFFVNQSPILDDDRRFGIRETKGHLIVLEWNGTTTLQCRLSLFNMWTHLIRFCIHYRGVWLPINSGHHFDIKSRTVNLLVSINKNLLIHREP